MEEEEEEDNCDFNTYKRRGKVDWKTLYEA